MSGVREAVIQNLFPTPVYMTNIDRPFTKQELQFVENQKNHTTKNEGNVSSIDNYILNRKELKNIKNIFVFIKRKKNNYFFKNTCKNKKVSSKKRNKTCKF